MIKRDETLPRVSELIRFISEEELDSIPRDRLEAKAAEGTRKHKILEDNYGKETNNLLSLMFKDGLNKILKPDELRISEALLIAPTFEEQINGITFTGKPDFRLGNTLIDYKFTNDLRAVTALQLIFYGVLIQEKHGIEMKRCYAFHYPNDYSLFIHKVPDRTMKPLLDYAYYVFKNHEAITAGELEKYEALARWEELLLDYEMFEPVAACFAPLTITSEEEAINAAVIYCMMLPIEKHGEKLKSELKRYMAQSGDIKISDINGYGIRLQTKNPKLHDAAKRKKAKAAYDEALEECQIGTVQTTSLVRFAPRAKKPKLIN